MTTDYTRKTDDELVEMFAPEATLVSLVNLGEGQIYEQVQDMLNERDPEHPGSPSYIAERIYAHALASLVNGIVSEVYDGDSRQERIDLEERVQDWLIYGSLDGSETAESLAAEWREYDSAEAEDAD